MDSRPTMLSVVGFLLTQRYAVSSGNPVDEVGDQVGDGIRLFKHGQMTTLRNECELRTRDALCELAVIFRWYHTIILATEHRRGAWYVVQSGMARPLGNRAMLADVGVSDHASWSSNVLASFRCAVSNPSVNHPYTSANRS
jgi:hypothetical protein